VVPPINGSVGAIDGRAFEYRMEKWTGHCTFRGGNGSIAVTGDGPGRSGVLPMALYYGLGSTAMWHRKRCRSGREMMRMAVTISFVPIAVGAELTPELLRACKAVYVSRLSRASTASCVYWGGRSALSISPAIGPTAALRLSDHDATRSPHKFLNPICMWLRRESLVPAELV
jgi:hypothetical protein